MNKVKLCVITDIKILEFCPRIVTAQLPQTIVGIELSPNKYLVNYDYGDWLVVSGLVLESYEYWSDEAEKKIIDDYRSYKFDQIIKGIIE